MAKGVKQQRASKHNWTAIRNEYVQTAASLRDLAAQFHVSPRQLAEHSTKESWVSQREQFRNKVTTTANERAVDKLADELLQGRKMATANARTILALIATKLGIASNARVNLKDIAKQYDALSLLRLAKGNEAAYLGLCQALGITPVENGGGDVELPEDLLNKLAVGVNGKAPDVNKAAASVNAQIDGDTDAQD